MTHDGGVPMAPGIHFLRDADGRYVPTISGSSPQEEVILERLARILTANGRDLPPGPDCVHPNQDGEIHFYGRRADGTIDPALHAWEHRAGARLLRRKRPWLTFA